MRRFDEPSDGQKKLVVVVVIKNDYASSGTKK